MKLNYRLSDDPFQISFQLPTPKSNIDTKNDVFFFKVDLLSNMAVILSIQELVQVFSWRPWKGISLPWASLGISWSVKMKILTTLPSLCSGRKITRWFLHSNILHCYLLSLEMIQFDDHIFSDGLVKNHELDPRSPKTIKRIGFHQRLFFK